MWLIFLFVLSITHAEQDLCNERCNRIHQRSMARVGFDDDKLRQLLEKQRPLGTTKDLCWRVYDHLDCMKQCMYSESHEAFAKFVRSKCQFALKEIESALLCVNRYHSFMEVRCSTFLNEAERLKKEMDASFTPTREICRFLHLNTLCLENTVTIYCANAKKIFRRLNFRDYFPSFILPTNDTLLDDLDLDACQMFDFVKKNNVQLEDDHLDEELKTVVNFFEAKNAILHPIITSTFSTTLKERKEFTTLLDELLEESPTDSESSLFESSTMAQMTTTSRPPTFEETTIVTTSINTSTTTSTSTTTMATPSTSNLTLFDVIQPPENDIKERYDDHAETEDVVVDVVPTQSVNSSVIQNSQTTTETPKTSPKSRLFSEDSWEQTPPNFHYSSLRFSNGGVTPLDIDTTTLFGFDDEDDDEYDDVDGGDSTDIANSAYNVEKGEKRGTEQTSAEMRTSTEKEMMEQKLKTPPSDSRYFPRQQNDVSVEQMNKQDEEVREFAAQSAMPMIENYERTTPLEAILKSDGENLNALERFALRKPLNEKLNLLPPHSTSPPSIAPMYDDLANANIQDWKELDGSPGYDSDDIGRLVESDTEEDEEALYPRDHSEASIAVKSTTALPDKKNKWFTDETLMLIYCIIFGVSSFAMMCLLMCLVWCRNTDQFQNTKPS